MAQTYKGVNTTPEMDALFKKRDGLINQGKIYQSKSGEVDKAAIDNMNSVNAQIATTEAEIEAITKKLKANKQSALTVGLMNQTSGSALMGGATESSVLTAL